MDKYCLVDSLLFSFIVLVTINVLPIQAQIAYPIGITTTGQNYTLTTGAIMGSAQVNSFEVNPPNSGVSLQLNTVLHVILTNDSSSDYLLQNAIQFPNADSPHAYVSSWIWNNFTNYYSNYVYDNFSKPFKISLAISEETIPQKGVEIQFLYHSANGTKMYQNKEIEIPNIQSSLLVISSNTPIHWLPYGTELVWAGEGNSQTANFTNMDSRLGLYYYDKTNTWKPFPEYSTNGYGRDTAEKAQNIYSFLDPNKPGQAVVLWENIQQESNQKINAIPEFGTFAYGVFLIGIAPTIAISCYLRSKIT